MREWGHLGYLNACHSIGGVPVAILICPGVRGVAGKNKKRALCRGSSAQFGGGGGCPDPNFCFPFFVQKMCYLKLSCEKKILIIKYMEQIELEILKTMVFV